MRDTEHSIPPWPFFAALVVVAFGFNWLWEMVQMPAYAEMVGRSWLETAPRCTQASLGDVALTLVVYGLGVLTSGCWRWGAEGGWNVYAAAALLGGLLATATEHIFLASGRWSYGERMPVVPGLGVGLWPLVQRVLLVPAALAVASWWARRPGGTGGPATVPHSREERR